MAADKIEVLRQAATLHDVGKIGIPDAILLKPGKLTPDEWTTMQAHTTMGARILAGSPHRLLQLAEEIALCHHERWDGTGYPRGLAGSRSRSQDGSSQLRMCSMPSPANAHTSEPGRSIRR